MKLEKISMNEPQVIEPDDEKYFIYLFGKPIIVRDTIFTGNFTHYGWVHTYNNLFRVLSIFLVGLNFTGHTVGTTALTLLGLFVAGINIVPLTNKGVYIKIW